MADSDGSAGTVDDRTTTPGARSTDVGALTGIVTDGVIGAVGGFAGTALLTVVLLVAATLGGFDVSSFATTARLVGAGALFGDRLLVPVGYFIFLGGGMTTWPLLFASLGEYLPGRNYAERGLVYGGVLWTGFVLAFYADYTGLSLAVYVLATLVGHLGFGFALGSVFDYLGTREGTLV
jgi:hypothetical protein